MCCPVSFTSVGDQNPDRGKGNKPLFDVASLHHSVVFDHLQYVHLHTANWYQGSLGMRLHLTWEPENEAVHVLYIGAVTCIFLFTRLKSSQLSRKCLAHLLSLHNTF